jgi:hypothetical protein
MGVKTMHKRIIWIHGDALSATNPARVAYSAAPAIFVWDEQLIADYQLSLKRMLFIYECLLEMAVVIRRGDVAKELLRFADEHQASEIVTVETPAPRFGHIATHLTRAGKTVTVYRPKPLIDSSQSFDLKRFSRYWHKAKPFAQQHSSQMRLLIE